MNAIQISGGIDSLALLFYTRPLWNDSIVMWADTGAAYPETAEFMERVKKLVPRFHTVYGDQPGVIKRNGFPVDVVPVKYSSMGELIFGPQPVKYQSYIDCCRDSWWFPMHATCLRLGVDTIYRGQRNEEKRKSPLRNGAIGDGIRLVFPLENWTREQVWDYVCATCPEWIPHYYTQGEHTSRDCWDCTAYRDDNVERVRNLPEEKRAVVTARLNMWQTHVMDELRGV